jgi:chromosome segregation ATPase
MRRGNLWTRLVILSVAVVCCLAIVTTVDAQSKKSAKQAESLEKAGERARAAVQDMMGGLGKLLTGYNSIIDGEAKDTQAAYKRLVNDLKKTEKSIAGAKKQLAAMNKEAEKFFKAWEQDLASISSEGLREKSASRMKAAKERYATLGDTLAQARDEFAPVVRNLNDQILYLGRDLSPEAIADLQDEAEELNRQAEEAKARVTKLLQSAGKTQDEAEEALEGDDAG